MKADLSALDNWFSQYCHSFSSPDSEYQRNISLKEHHTHNVRQNILTICREEALSPEQQDIAEIIALFHDIGRFPQYHQYKTFKDSDSVNHAALGVQILTEKHVLAAFSKPVQDVIIKSIRFHNVFILPGFLSPEESLFLKLIRDADKLDIWRVFIEFYTLPEGERASAVGLGFPDVPGFSDEVISTLNNRQIVNLTMLRTMNDFKLLQLSWVFDLNFAASFRMLKCRDYISTLAATLPENAVITEAISRIYTYVDEKLAGTPGVESV